MTLKRRDPFRLLPAMLPLAVATSIDGRSILRIAGRIFPLPAPDGTAGFMVLAVWHGLFPFFKVQAGLAFAFGFVKDTLFDKHFFPLGELPALRPSCPPLSGIFGYMLQAPGWIILRR